MDHEALEWVCVCSEEHKPLDSEKTPTSMIHSPDVGVVMGVVEINSDIKLDKDSRIESSVLNNNAQKL